MQHILGGHFADEGVPQVAEVVALSHQKEDIVAVGTGGLPTIAIAVLVQSQQVPLQGRAVAVKVFRVDHGQMHPVGVVRGVVSAAGIDHQRHLIFRVARPAGAKGLLYRRPHGISYNFRGGKTIAPALHFPPNVGGNGKAHRVPARIVVDKQPVTAEVVNGLGNHILVAVRRGKDGLHDFVDRQARVGGRGQAAQQDDFGGFLRQGIGQTAGGAARGRDVGGDGGIEGFVVEAANQFVPDGLVFRGDVPRVQQGGCRVLVVLNGFRQQAQSSPHPLKVGVVGQPLLDDCNDAGMKGIAVVEILLFPGVMGPAATPQVGIGAGSFGTGRLVPLLKEPLPQDGGQVSILGGRHIVAGAGDNGIHFGHSVGQQLR